LSKLGFCSRGQAKVLVEAGRVRVNGQVRSDPEWRVNLEVDHCAVDGQTVRDANRIYLVLNKPRGLVTSASDEQGRPTVFHCLEKEGLPFLSPVGRLDKASEGMLLFTNDTAWAALVTAPERHLDKTYHVQVDCVPGEALLQEMIGGVRSDGELLAARRVRLLRQGTKTSWLEVVLDEGKNRHIRRLLAGLGVSVLRLVRVAIGDLQLGSLAKGESRRLTETEVRHLAPVKAQPGAQRG
jgi:23S rRNA pseudouridine2605 synthase